MIKAYAVMEAGGELVPFEYDPGELQPHEVEIDVHSCGICFSDLAFIDDALGITPYPLVPGHEVAGTIAKVGEAVKNLKVGQRVGLGWHAGYCNDCEPCRAGDHNLCASAQPTIVAHHGGYADKVRAAANSVVPIPDSIALEEAGPLFCGGITVFNPLVQYGIKPTDKVGVIGIGGLGHMALQFLNAWGCDVTAFTSHPEKKEDILTMGAHHVLSSVDPQAIQSAAGRFDLIMFAGNVKLDWNLYLSTLKPRGRLHLAGGFLEPIDVSWLLLLSGQLSVSSSPVGSPATIARMLDFAALHNIKPIIEKYKFSEVNEAVAKVRNGQGKYRVVLCN